MLISPTLAESGSTLKSFVALVTILFQTEFSLKNAYGKDEYLDWLRCVAKCIRSSVIISLRACCPKDAYDSELCRPVIAHRIHSDFGDMQKLYTKRTI